MIVGVCNGAGVLGIHDDRGAARRPARVPGAIVAECDPSGGDLAAWAQCRVRAGLGDGRRRGRSLVDRPGDPHPTLPSGLPVLFAPPGRPRPAPPWARRPGVSPGCWRDAAGGVRRGRLRPDRRRRSAVGGAVASSPCCSSRQVPQSAPATVAVVDRALEALPVLRAGCDAGRRRPRRRRALSGPGDRSGRSACRCSACCPTTASAPAWSPALGRSVGGPRAAPWPGPRASWPRGSSQRFRHRVPPRPSAPDRVGGGGRTAAGPASVRPGRTTLRVGVRTCRRPACPRPGRRTVGGRRSIMVVRFEHFASWWRPR